MKTNTTKYPPLAELSSWQLENSDQDIRGWTLYSAPGQPLGTIDELLANKKSELVEAVRLNSGSTVPVEHVLIGDDCAFLARAAHETPVVCVYD